MYRKLLDDAWHMANATEVWTVITAVLTCTWGHLFRGISNLWQHHSQLLRLPGKNVPPYLTTSILEHLRLFLVLFPIHKRGINIPEQTPLHTSLFVPKNSAAESQMVHIFKFLTYHHQTALHKSWAPIGLPLCTVDRFVPHPPQNTWAHVSPLLRRPPPYLSV